MKTETKTTMPISALMIISLFITNTYAYIPPFYKTSSSQTTHNNSQLNFNNLTTTSAKDTVINGATVYATDSLQVDAGKELKISSVQDTSSNSSQTVSVGTSNQSASIHKDSSTQTVVTSLKGGAVAINTQGNTDLSGATVSSTNDDLTLNTGTLTHSDLSNRKISKTISIGASSNSGSVGYNTQNSKTKTLSTIGSGTINIKDKENSSDTTKLNRDTDNSKIDIYDVKRDVSVSVEVDARLLSESGRAQIADDLKKSKVGFIDVAKDIITKDSVGILDSFTHQGNKVDMYTGVQNAIKNSKTLQDQLSNPNLTREQKNQLLVKIASSVAKELNIDISKIDTISTNTKTKDGDEIKGGYHKQSGDIVINDKNSDSTGDALNTIGHELTHSMDDQRGTQRSEASSDEYANIMGSGMEDYAGFAMWNYSDGKTLSSSNTHNGLNPSTDNSVAKSVFGTRVRDNEVEFMTKQEADKTTEEYPGLASYHDPRIEGGYGVASKNQAATIATNGTAMTQEQIRKINKNYKDGIITGLKATETVCAAGATVCKYTPGLQGYYIPLATGAVGSNYILYKMNNKSKVSITRDTIIDIISPPNLVGDLVGKILKNTTDELDKNKE